jgi:hypothetical protein
MRAPVMHLKPRVVDRLTLTPLRQQELPDEQLVSLFLVAEMKGFIMCYSTAKK